MTAALTENATATSEASSHGAHDSRERIMVEATRLFVERGYHGISMREIAEAVGFSKPALYHHFADKESLFEAILSANVANLSVMISSAVAASSSASDALERIVRGILERPLEERAVMRLGTNEMIHLSEAGRARFNLRYYAEFINPLRTVIVKGIEEGEFRSVEPEMATWALLGMLYPYFHNRGGPPPSEETIRQVVALYLHGLSN
jgi:AcrR family transcriptional regulator